MDNNYSPNHHRWKKNVSAEGFFIILFLLERHFEGTLHIQEAYKHIWHSSTKDRKERAPEM